MDDKELQELVAQKAKLKAERQAARDEKRKRRKHKREVKAQEREQLNAEMKVAKVELNKQIKEINEAIKKIKAEYKEQLKVAKAQSYQDRTAKHTRLAEIKEHRSDDILVLKNKKIDLKFDFGKKYNTLA